MVLVNLVLRSTVPSYPAAANIGGNTHAHCACHGMKDADGLPIDLTERSIYAYADDILVICDNRADLVRAISCIERLIDETGLAANVGKCVIMCIDVDNWPHDFEHILYKGEPLPTSNQYAYLGLIFQVKLNGELMC